MPKGIYKRTRLAKINMRLSHLGYVMPEEQKRNISESNKGEKHWNWKGGITTENSRIRRSREYVEWRTKIYIRDNYTCQNCGQIGGKLVADHIKPFADYPELRFDLNNGRTLCHNCHIKIGANWGKNVTKYYASMGGKIGGAKTLKKYGVEHFRKIAKLPRQFLLDKKRKCRTVTTPIVFKA